ncbi:MAG: DUF4426 domain-containing protein [Thioalkalivibrio sp.]|nr:MAG: DUF4426 domain-containing protein [Thioalkalivibrio sp.]
MERLRNLLVITSLGLLALLVAAAPVHANEVEFDRYIVHYSVLSTHFLSPEVARAYDLRRSRSRALVNIAIMKRDSEEMESVPGTVRGQAQNLNRQVRHLRFRQIRAGDAYYHLAEVRVRPGEVLDFTLEVTAEDDDEAMPVNFQHVIYRY